ncbi:hypothetical protein EON64_08455, partial [archaeon]
MYGGWYTFPITNLTVMPNPIITSITPLWGITTMTTQIIATGVFAPAPSVCVFSAPYTNTYTYTQATYINQTAITCLAPVFTDISIPTISSQTQAPNKQVTVRVAYLGDGDDVYGAGVAVAFTYYDAPSSSHIVPSSGAAGIIHTVMVFGDRFPTADVYGHGVGVVCVFDTYQASGVIRNSTLVECAVPNGLGIGTFPVRIVFSDGDGYGDGTIILPFTLYAPPTILTATPSLVMRGVRQEVTLQVQDIRVSRSTRCVLDGDVMDAVAITANQLVCSVFVNSTSLASTITIGISQNGGYEVDATNIIPLVDAFTVSPINTDASTISFWTHHTTTITTVITHTGAPRLPMGDLFCIFSSVALSLPQRSLATVSPPMGTETTISCPVVTNIQASWQMSVELPGGLAGWHEPVSLDSWQLVELVATTPGKLVLGTPTLMSLVFAQPVSSSLQSQLSCRLAGSHMAPLLFQHSLEAICSVVAIDCGFTSLQLLVGGGNSITLSRSLLVECIDRRLTAFPTLLPANGQSIVAFVGTNFSQRSTYSCLYKDSSISAKTISFFKIECPISSSEASEVLQLAEDGNIIGSADLTFYSNATTVDRIALKVAASGGFMPIKLTSAQFINFDLYMVTDESYRLCSLTDPVTHMYVCYFTPSVAGNIWEIFFSLNKQDLLPQSWNVEVVEDPVVFSAVPLQGGVQGGTEVRMTGRNFPEFHMFCFFGSIQVPAEVQSSTSLVCISPSVPSEGKISLSVGLNDWQVTATPVSFDYVTLPTVLAIDPATGPEAGGTAVKLTMSNSAHLPALFCAFGLDGNTVAASLTTGGGWVCLSPTTFPGHMPVRFSVDGQTFVDYNISYYSYPLPSITNMLPKRGSCVGGTNVTVFGSNFLKSTKLSCKFGEQVVAAHFINRTAVSCFTPKVEVAGNATVAVSFNNQDYHMQRRGGVFAFVESQQLGSISPSVVVAGYATAVKLPLSEQSSTLSHFCRVSRHTMIVQQLSSGIYCEIPSDLLVGTLQLELLAVDYAVLHSFTLSVVLAPQIVSVSPRVLSQLGGSVTLSGSNFLHALDIHCIVGSTIVPSTVFSASQLRCLLPPLEPSQLTVGLYLADQNITIRPATAKVTILVPPRVIDVSPRVVSTNAYNSIQIQCLGDCQLDGLSCKFTAGNSTLYTTLTMVQGSTFCPVPPLTAGAVQLSFSSEHQSVLPQTFLLQVIEDPSVMSVTPLQGSVLGGTVVR